jgi:hypothetical protein
MRRQLRQLLSPAPPERDIEAAQAVHTRHRPTDDTSAPVHSPSAKGNSTLNQGSDSFNWRRLFWDQTAFLRHSSLATPAQGSRLPRCHVCVVSVPAALCNVHFPAPTTNTAAGTALHPSILPTTCRASRCLPVRRGWLRWRSEKQQRGRWGGQQAAAGSVPERKPCAAPGGMRCALLSQAARFGPGMRHGRPCGRVRPRRAVPIYRAAMWGAGLVDCARARARVFVCANSRARACDVWVRVGVSQCLAPG